VRLLVNSFGLRYSGPVRLTVAPGAKLVELAKLDSMWATSADSED
jgi:hypothetical protein